MKHIILLVVLYVSTHTTYAQIIEIPNSRGMIDNIKTVKPTPLNFLPKTNALFSFDKGKSYEMQTDVLIKGTFLIQNLNGKRYLIPLDGLLSPVKRKPVKRNDIISDTSPQAKLLYNTDKGKVYSLPLDNMRCLVPDEMYTLNESKHYRQHYPPSSIPNPYNKYDIIPDEQHGKISGVKVIPNPSK